MNILKNMFEQRIVLQKRSIHLISGVLMTIAVGCQPGDTSPTRERISINEDWLFMKYASDDNPDTLIYDVRPEVFDTNDDKQADAKPTEAISVKTKRFVLKPWILPTGNEFLSKENQYKRPEGHPGQDFDYVKSTFNDQNWDHVDLPHDWAISGPFYEGWNTPVGGGMGRLPSPGIAWYRKKIFLPESDTCKSIYLDIDGAMSYAMVWINGKLAGGWPYGYSSFRVDLTPYIETGKENQLAIRLDNPPNSSRWYPGGGLYRNVWLVKASKVHVAHWGTFVNTQEITSESAKLNLKVTVDNSSDLAADISIKTEIYALNSLGKRIEPAVANTVRHKIIVKENGQTTLRDTVVILNPKLWGPPPTQTPHRYIAETSVWQGEQLVDQYTTPFGIRKINYDPNRGVIVNGEHIYIKGVNQHHDLGALGAAFNKSAALRQLAVLKEMGCNAIRMAHNPPARELLDLTDSMGFLVVNELYDCWERKKTPLDFHLIFPKWHEQDLRALIRRDKNHPSVIMWSTGNEVGEQYTGEAGARIAQRLKKIANDEDPTRPTTASFNYAKPDMPITAQSEVVSLNYQGEGIRNAPAYSHLNGINTPPLYPSFRESFPEKVIISSENAAALSTRGTYLFPVAKNMSAPVSDSSGGDPERKYVSAYELYTANFGSSTDKVFASLDQHPYVAGGFVWSGWDYLGEPTPYYLARSSYFGIIDLAGFKKDRFYLFQSKWRPDLPMVHILPHWNWPNRPGETTPVHVFTSGDEAELFLNGKSLGRKRKGPYEYRLKWDEVLYEPGEVEVIAYKNGEEWARQLVKTTRPASQLELSTDQKTISADGKELSFITLKIKDENALTVPTANDLIKFSVSGPGEIVATDNGDPTDLTPFPSSERKAFNGKALVIVRGKRGETGTIIIKAESQNLTSHQINISSN